jgi:selenocysteine lyase/cysteine desulfurase
VIDWSELRQEHLGKTDLIYLNSPANGIISSRNIENEYAETEKYLKNPGKYRMQFLLETLPVIREKLGKILNANASQFALLQNFSIGMAMFSASLPKQTKILLLKGDYPSLQMPFEESGMQICWFDFEEDYTLDIGKLESFIELEKPEIVAISHCQWLTGYLADLESIGAICKKYYCTFLVDATQSFGAIPIDIKKCNIDVLGASCYKWALAGFGNGFLYIKEEILSKYIPQTAGFGSYSWHEGKPFYKPSMKSYEAGHHDHEAFHRLHYALTQILNLGLDNIHSKINELMDYLLDQLTQNNVSLIGDFMDENRLGIVSIASQPGLFKRLINNNIEISERGGNIRLGVHYYNSEDDIDYFITALSLFT